MPRRHSPFPAQPPGHRAGVIPEETVPVPGLVQLCKKYTQRERHTIGIKTFIVLPEGIDIIGKLGESGYILSNGDLGREQLKGNT